jgi:glycosyltransferase involved in cell wall biosynthesis
VRVLGIGKFYPPEYHGGLESVVTTLNAELVRRGVEVTYVVSALGRAGHLDDVGGVRVVRVPTLATVLSQPLTPGLAAAVRREAGDVVHLHHPNPLGDVAALGDRDRPLVITHHSDIVRQRFLRPFYGLPLRRALARARLVAVGSHQLVATSRELRGFEHKARIVPFGIDPTRFELTPEIRSRAAALRESWGWADAPTVLAVGRLVGYKGFDRLIRALAPLEARLVMVGTGPAEARLRSLAGGRVRFAGRVSDADLVAHYHAADLFCLPSVTIAEAFGIVLLEAMACGRPLVTTTLPTGVSAVNRDGVTGLSVPPGDVGALREAVRALVHDPGRRAAMGEAARRVFAAEYTASRMAERYLSLYAEALGSRAAGA